MLEGLRGEESIATLCRRESIVTNLYYRWSKDFLEADKKQLARVEPRAYLRETTLWAVQNPGRATLARELKSPEP